MTDNTTGVMLTGDRIMIYRAMTIRRGMILKIDTGMNLTRVPCLSAAKRSGLTSARTNRLALRDVNAWLLSHGVRPAWSKKYPQG